jgi:hypothetical protein
MTTSHVHRLAGALGLVAVLAAAGCAGGGTGSSSAAKSGSATPTPAPASSAPASSAPATPPSPAAPEANAAGDIPDNQQFVAYTPASGLFTVKIPEGWSRTEASGTVTFTDKLNSVRVDTAARPTAPSEAGARAELDALRSGSGHFSGGKVSTVSRHAGRAILTTYRADAPANAVTGKVVNDDVERYQFWRNGQLVTLVLAGPHGADNVDPWRIVTDSFGWGR